MIILCLLIKQNLDNYIKFSLIELERVRERLMEVKNRRAQSKTDKLMLMDLEIML